MSALPDDAASPALSGTRWPAGRPIPADEAANYDRMVATLRGFLDTLAGARPEPGIVAELAADLAAWTARLQDFTVEETEQIYARLMPLPGRGQATAPPMVVEHSEPGELRGHVTFGRYFLGVNGAVHGGVLALLFDDLMGRVAADPSRRRLRTAHLHVDYRVVTPVDTRLEVRGWLDRVEGRKRFVRGELRHGDVVCAEAKGLFLTLQDHHR